MIDYRKIADAIDHYTECGYQYIEVPWIISLDSLLVTRPMGARIFSTFAGELVASGEQSFIEIRKELKPGKYQCVTPCFRDEQVHDDLHKQYFLKNELIWVPEPGGWPYDHLVDRVIGDAFRFFKKYGSTKIIDNPLPNAFCNKDILINEIEVGSYGFRAHDDFAWVYGTGCAEPRLTQTLKKE
jgi:hypothetical protein